MDFALTWKTILTIIYGTLILRIAGRKSLAQMTIAQTVVMLAVGTVLIEPLVGQELPNTFFVVAIVVGTLILIEYSEIRLPFLKKLFTGEPVILIENGKINRENLKRVRMTIQQLEMELRQASIANASDVKWATIEPNGQFGFVLKDELQPIGQAEYQHLLKRLETIEFHIKGANTDTEKTTLVESPRKVNNDFSSEENVFKKLKQEKTTLTNP
ncbi:hypothetical protein SOV_32960 [Sporomusa ovata DSM 2662]|uniref:YDFR protein n=1 Tax=Sporomusa ovata TaxID=2378 RepID=A0A0U1L4I5_9FIRM|nr:YetF domain-containing protein [Sporomusa ovata]EQB25232.1 hypothetical protein SOV_5c04000 [Sporomusa ovata DSM 2662]CQR73794.1 YDFR protein [Sporomusa ovata]